MIIFGSQNLSFLLRFDTLAQVCNLFITYSTAIAYFLEKSCIDLLCAKPYM